MNKMLKAMAKAELVNWEAFAKDEGQTDDRDREMHEQAFQIGALWAVSEYGTQRAQERLYQELTEARLRDLMAEVQAGRKALQELSERIGA